MSTVVTPAPGDAASSASGGALVSAIDRWIYVFMAVSFITYVLVGFVPDSLMKMSLVEAGQRAPFPAALHVHAVLMGAYLLLLLSQTTLMATGPPPAVWSACHRGCALPSRSVDTLSHLLMGARRRPLTDA